MTIRALETGGRSRVNLRAKGCGTFVHNSQFALGELLLAGHCHGSVLKAAGFANSVCGKGPWLRIYNIIRYLASIVSSRDWEQKISMHPCSQLKTD